MCIFSFRIKNVRYVSFNYGLGTHSPGVWFGDTFSWGVVWGHIPVSGVV